MEEYNENFINMKKFMIMNNYYNEYKKYEEKEFEKNQLYKKIFSYDPDKIEKILK